MSDKDSNLANKIVDIMLPLDHSPAMEGAAAREYVDMEARLIAKSRVDTDLFTDIVFKKKDIKVCWEWLGEGLEGDYDETNPGDYPHLRFSCSIFRRDVDDVASSGDWEELDNTSYCTRLPISTPKWMLRKATKEILESISGGTVDKQRLEGLSWLTIDDFKGKNPGDIDKISLVASLFDNSKETLGPLKCRISVEGGTIWIAPDGYGDNSSRDGCGTPIAVEVWEGRLRVLAWDDINSCDPKVVDMENSRESLRLTGQMT